MPDRINREHPRHCESYACCKAVAPQPPLSRSQLPRSHTTVHGPRFTVYGPPSMIILELP